MFHKSINSATQIVHASIRESVLTRVFDIISSAIGLLLLSPLLVIIAFMIKVSSSGSIFQKAKRVGKDNQIFQLYKFRITYLGKTGSAQSDLWLTPLGRFLRQTRLDQLPQLINVFRGDMSLVGPRPESPHYVALFTPEQRQLLSVRPGITSPGSFYYRHEEALLNGEQWEEMYWGEIMPHKLSLDLAYLKQRTPWSDLILILKTLWIMVYSEDKDTPLSRVRNRHVFAFDLLALLFIPTMALTLRLDNLDWWSSKGQALMFFTAVSLLIKIPIFYHLGLYRRYWRFASVGDLTPIFIAVSFTTIILMVLFAAVQQHLAPFDLAIPRTLPLIDGLLTCLVVAGFRFSLRGLYHWQKNQSSTGGRRVLVVGAGEGGNMVVRELRANPQLDMEVAAFVDDDPNKIGTQIQGLPVLGTINDIPDLLDAHQIQRIIVALPSIQLTRQQEIIKLCEQTGIKTHNLPGVFQILAGHKTISHVPQIDINHLLHRKPIVIEETELSALLRDATILVTGAGGSIGSELCRQVARFNPAAIVLLGHGENSIFEIKLDLTFSFPKLITHAVIADVRDQEQINSTIANYRPDVIFHAAAHKHVPLMEASVKEAIVNNVIGTLNVVRAAERYGVERFILISTDKAVNPTSIMGATKRLAELLVMATARRSGRAYMAVRFGNVLGSRGSVIRIFQQQIAAGGPLTITHPDMYRYFMTIPEAVQLVLQSAVLGQGSEVFTLDMGQQIRIFDLAIDLLKLSGLEADRDIKIAFSGVRPGEKLREELFLNDETYRRTRHPKVLMGNHREANDAEVLEQVVLELINLVRRMPPQTNVKKVKETILQICYFIDQYQSDPQQKLSDTIDVKSNHALLPISLHPSPSGL